MATWFERPTTAEAIGLYQVARWKNGKAIVATAAQSDLADAVLGICTYPRPANQIVKLQVYGLLQNGNWGWRVDEPIYVGAAGELTQDMPDGVVRVIAVALKPNTIWIDHTTPGATGPQGPAGQDTAGTLTLTAGEPLGGHRAVRVLDGELWYASSADPDTAVATVGITSGAAAYGHAAEVVTHGPIEEPSWAWNPGPVYLGIDGLLTQTPPSSGAVLQIGVAESATVLLVSIKQPIRKA